MFFSGNLPFPADLLVSEYNPWKYNSYLGYNPASIPNKAQYFDTIRQIYPWKIFSINAIRSGEIPLWNPYSFSGTPLLANFQSSVFYPFNLFYFILNEKIAWSILVFIQPLLTSFFTYFFLREIGITKKSSIFASIAFSYSLFMSVFLEYNIIGQTFLWLSLLLFIFEKLLKKISIFRIFSFSLVFMFSFFAGHIQIFGFVFLFTVIYAIFRLIIINWNKVKKITFFFFFLFLTILSIGTISIQLFPTLELINLSARTTQNYNFLLEKLLIQPLQLVLFISPDFFGNPATRNYVLSDSYPGNALYIGLIPFIFSFFSIFLIKKSQFIKFFIGISLFLLFFLVRTPLSEVFYLMNIPFFSTGSPTNSIFLLSFCLIVLSAFGLDYYEKNNKEKSKYILTLFFALFAIVWLIILFIKPEISIKNFIYSTSLFALVSSIMIFSNVIKSKNFIVITFIFLTIFDLFYFFQKFNPFTDPRIIFPDEKLLTFIRQEAGLNRVWGYGKAGIEPNIPTYYSFFSTDGYDPLYSRRYGEFIQSSKEGRIVTEFTNATRSDALMAPGYGEGDLGSNTFRLRVMDSLGVKYIIDRKDNASTEKTFPSDRFKLVHEEDGWKIFQNIKASPRAFLTTHYRVFRNNREFEKMFFSKDFDPSKIILLEEEINLQKKEDFEGKLKLENFKNNEMKFSSNANSDNLLFISDSFYPGWQAFIDSKKTKIYRANYAFRAVVVPKGKHEIIFKFNPQSFSLGKKTSIISLILLLIFSVLASKKPKYNK